MSRDAEPAGGRLQQLRAVFEFTRQRDPKLLPIMVLPALLVLAAGIGVGFAIGHPVYLGILGFLAAVLWTVNVFGRRSMSAQYASVEGQPGAAAAVLNTLRGNWKVQPAVAFNKNQDLVHRVVGRPGIVLVGEGAKSRVEQLLAQERKRVARVAADTPVYDVQVGNEQGQVTLRKLQNHLMRLPRNLRSKDVDAVEVRLRALGGPAMPIPKGPIPRSGRMPRGKLR